MMKVIEGFPPNIAAIEERFGKIVRNEGTVFAFAPNVYVVGRGRLHPAIRAHERVHFKQQGKDPEGWWKRYLSDDQFRYDQELAAHRAEWHHVRANVRDRNDRATTLRQIGGRLSSPLYGSMVDLDEAVRVIKR